MISWNIFTHSVRQVFGNLRGALQVSGILYIISNAAVYFFGGDIMFDREKMQQMMMDGTMPWGTVAIGFIIAIIAAIWTVIAWHRYILLNETATILPAFKGREMLTYFGKGVLLMLILIPLGAVFGAIVGILAGTIATAAMSGDGPNMALIAGVTAITTIAVLIPIAVIGYRLSVLFPSAALGIPMGFGAAWGKMVGQNKMLIALALITVVVSLFFSIPAFVLDETSPLLMAYNFVLGWVQMIVGASIVTTLYGHFVEGRPLAA